MTFNDWIPNLQVEVKTASTGLLARTLRWTLQDFCQRTHYWQEVMEPLTLLPFNDKATDTYIYTLPLPTHARLITIRELIYNDHPLLERQTSWLDEKYPDWRTATGDPCYFLMLTNRQVRFVPAAAMVQPIAVSGRLILEPNRDSLTIPEPLETYEEGLIHGALARLLTIKGKPWTDGQRAALCQHIYEQTVSDARQLQMRDWTYGRITTEQAAWT